MLLRLQIPRDQLQFDLEIEKTAWNNHRKKDIKAMSKRITFHQPSQRYSSKSRRKYDWKRKSSTTTPT